MYRLTAGRCRAGERRSQQLNVIMFAAFSDSVAVQPDFIQLRYSLSRIFLASLPRTHRAYGFTRTRILCGGDASRALFSAVLVSTARCAARASAHRVAAKWWRHRHEQKRVYQMRRVAQVVSLPLRGQAWMNVDLSNWRVEYGIIIVYVAVWHLLNIRRR